MRSHRKAIVTPWNFVHIYLDAEAEGDPLARRVLDRLPDVPLTRVENPSEFLRSFPDFHPGREKRRIWITRFKGPLVKECPGTGPSYLCCRYYVINSQLNCPMECSYCILQNYLDSPFLTIYTNLDAAKREMRELIEGQPRRLFRIGTGELTDSLALDDLTETGRELIDWCRGKKVILELKTKTDRVGHLPVAEGGNAVISWSLNPEEVIRAEEFGAAGLQARLSAAL
ncbi:MAG TPA: radical SAM protein, partial [Candidatus Omnitrophota bacterium]|nr:radical SAM protein [Candidatus Omnitrophota bacterium]